MKLLIPIAIVFLISCKENSNNEIIDYSIKKDIKGIEEIITPIANQKDTILYLYVGLDSSLPVVKIGKNENLSVRLERRFTIDDMQLNITYYNKIGNDLKIERDSNRIVLSTTDGCLDCAMIARSLLTLKHQGYWNFTSESINNFLNINSVSQSLNIFFPDAKRKLLYRSIVSLGDEIKVNQFLID